MKTNTLRRTNGDGSVRKRKDGRWEARIPLGNDPFSGKRKTRYIYARTLEELHAKIREVILNPQEIVTPNGRYVKIENSLFAKYQLLSGGGQILYRDWLDIWMSDYKLNSISPSTFASYSLAIETHIKPMLGNIKIIEITTEQIQRFLNTRQQEGTRLDSQSGALSSSYTIKMKNIINASLKQAVNNRMIPFNPTNATSPPKLIQREIRILTPEEQQLLIATLSGHRLEALFILALSTGMRKGELMALTWNCIDFTKMQIRVRSSVSRTVDPITKISAIKPAPTKTKSGRRTIPLLPSMIPILEKHKKNQDSEKSIEGKRYNPGDLIFCSNVGTYIEPHRINTTLNKLLKKAGITHISFHALRHTFASRALENGIPAKVVSEVLGHSDISHTLNVYSHLLDSTSHKELFKINSLFI